MNQKEAVFQAVTNVMGTVEGGAYEPSKEQRAQVNSILFEGFRAGTIELSKEIDDAGLKAYCSGLQSNWLRKDKRLNGGVNYVPANPGSRAGSGDSQLKALRGLMTTVSTDEDKAEIQKHIDARLAEVGAAKAKTVTIDYSALPESIRAKFAK